jgi:N-methylhydantoinase B
MVENSGGPGEYRGAPAYQREYRFLSEETLMVMRSDRRRFLPYGLNDGNPGTPSWNLRNTGTADQAAIPVMPMEAVVFRQGETFLHVSAGGGGHGIPLKREPAAVLDDIREERFTADYARDVYGVVISGEPPAIDADATKMLRRKMADKPQDTARPAYLRYFHDSLGITEFRLIGPREMEV